MIKRATRKTAKKGGTALLQLESVLLQKDRFALNAMNLRQSISKQSPEGSIAVD